MGRDLTELELRRWARDLDRREAELADEKDRFEQHVAGFQDRADQIADLKVGGVLDAFRVIRAAFPGGFQLNIEPWGPGAGGSVH